MGRAAHASARRRTDSLFRLFVVLRLRPPAVEECSIRLVPAGCRGARRPECKLRPRRLARHHRRNLLTLLTFFVVWQNAEAHPWAKRPRPIVFWALLAVAAARRTRRRGVSVSFSDYPGRRSARGGSHTRLRLARAVLAPFVDAPIYRREMLHRCCSPCRFALTPNLKDLAPPRPAQDAATQSRTVYYPFQAAGTTRQCRIDLGLSAEFESPGQKSAPVLIGSAGWLSAAFRRFPAFRRCGRA